MMFRPATREDISSIDKIYLKIHNKEQNNELKVGWIKGVYPVRKTAVDALERNDLFVYEKNGEILASAIINQVQVDVYQNGKWIYDGNDSEVMVLHTLVVDPDKGGCGIGTKFVDFYEHYALESGCHILRMDTNEKNTAARNLYKKLGYREADIVPCEFNGIPDVNLVLLEKKI